MSTKQDFTEQEWEQIIAGPPGAGMLVITAQRGGMFKETLSMAKAYAEARQQHGQSELLDEIVATKPKLDHTRYHSPEELREHVLSVLGEARSTLAARPVPRSSTSTGLHRQPDPPRRRRPQGVRRHRKA